jgi:hypothetical protein
MNGKLVAGTSVPQREEKHIIIDSSLSCLETQIKSLERLLDRIKGQDSPKEAVEPAPQHACLYDFMECTPDRINAYTERIRVLIDQLKQSIF